MGVRLQAIKFNHDQTSYSADAFNIRRNATQFIDVPEWQFGQNFRHDDSLAAYAIRDTLGRTITIQAQFSALDQRFGEIEIRAIDPMRGWFRRLFHLPGFNVLGQVKAREVAFPAEGVTEFETFELEGSIVHNRGVGVSAVTWLWQYREPERGWVDFETSRHQIYVVSEIPNKPWVQVPYARGNTQLPWTEVMDYACGWAVYAQNVDDAASLVTRRVNDLGGSVLQYDCPGSGLTHYCTSKYFWCSRFLEHLQGAGGGNGPYVNCVDCAAIVSTFSNILGANLFQSSVESDGSPFTLNPVRFIGYHDWSPCLKGFGFHEVAWKGPCKENNEIFDACLQVDGDDDPVHIPHVPLLATNLKFGASGAMLYRDRLVIPADRTRVRPSGGKQRLLVS